MASLRRDLDENVDDVFQGARALTDWTTYVKKYPWICVGAAMAVGYLVVPSKVNVIRPTADELEKLAKRERLIVEPKSRSATQKSGGLSSQVATFAANAALRAALAYAGQNMGKFLGVEAAKPNQSEQRQVYS